MSVRQVKSLAEVLYAHLWEGSSMPKDEAECCAKVVIDFLTALGERQEIQEECAVDLFDDNYLEARAVIRRFITAAGGSR